jgi:hypothetical protein
MKTLCIERGGIKIPSRNLSQLTKQGDQSCVLSKTSYLSSLLWVRWKGSQASSFWDHQVATSLFIALSSFSGQLKDVGLHNALFNAFLNSFTHHFSCNIWEKFFFARSLRRIQLWNNYTKLQSKVGTVEKSEPPRNR